MKMKLTKPFRVQLDAGAVVDVNEKYAATLKALNVAETFTTTKKPAQKRDTKKKED